MSLQNLLELPLIVGGRTALEVQGVSHYLTQSVRQVHLYGPVRLPTWTEHLPLDVKFHRHNNGRLFSNDPVTRGLTSIGYELKQSPGWSQDSLEGYRQITWGHWDWPITLSTPERAYLELLDQLPSDESFHLADKLMEGLPHLSPSRMKRLLADCRSVKVKRLFFFFADRHSHAWRRQLIAEDFDLGSGKRALVKGGKFDAHYQITVPEDLDG